MALPLIGPDGKRYYLGDPSELEQAIAAGYRPETPEAPQTLGEQAKATVGEGLQVAGTAAEGALRGFAPGLMGAALGGEKREAESPEDFARRKFDAEQMDKRRKEHPVASFGGELAGIVASPLSKIQPAVASSLGASSAVGRIGANIAGGAVEGSLYGAGNAVDEAALGNVEVTAEKLIAGAGLGALLGGGGGGLGTALGEGFKAAAPLAARAAKEFAPGLENFANRRWLKAAGGIQSDIKKIPQEQHGAVAAEIKAALSPDGQLVPRSLDDAAEALGAEREALADGLLKSAGLADAPFKPGMARDEALEALEAGFKAANGRKLAVIDLAEAAGAKMNLGSLARRLDEFEGGLSPIKQEAISADLAAVRRALEKYEAKGSGGFRAMDEFRVDVASKAKWEKHLFGADLKQQLAGIVRDEVDGQLGRLVGPELAQQFASAKQALGAFFSAEKALKRKEATGADALAAIIEKLGLKQAPEARRLSALNHAAALMKHGQERELGNRWISASDYLAGIGAGVGRISAGDPFGALQGLAVAVGHKVMREKGSGIAAALADRLSKSPQLKLAAQSFSQKAQQAMPSLGQYAGPLAQAIAHSPVMGLATHLVMAETNPDYAETAARAGFLPETAEEAGHAAAKATALVGVAAALKETGDAIAKGVDKVFKASGRARGANTTSRQDFGTRRMRIQGAEAHKRRMDEIAQLAANPEALVERVTNNIQSLGDYAPGLVAASTAVAHRAVAYLSQQIQRPPKPGPLASEWVFPKADLFVFSKKLETVEEPLSVLEHAAAGTLTKDQIQALQTVYPAVYGQIRDTALEKLSESPKGVPYKARLMLSLLTGVDPDGTLGKSVSLNQQVFAARQEQQQPPPPSDSGESTLARAWATPEQRREMRRDET
jgi:hypothetical protein